MFKLDKMKALTKIVKLQLSIGDYKLPFEEEVGLHPTLEDMQESVVHKKERPAILETWRQHPVCQFEIVFLSLFVNSIQ